MKLTPIDPRKDHPEHFCADCDLDTLGSSECYMLKASLWKQIAKSDHKAMLCLACSESRLGRSLNQADFSSARLNRMSAEQCLPLRRRLNRKAPK